MSKGIKKTYYFIGITIILILGAAAVYTKYFRYTGPEKDISKLHEKYYYLNLAEGINYVGDQKCQPCHAGLFDSYHTNGMGSSLFRLTKEKETEDFEKENTIYDAKSDYYYQVYKKNDVYYQKEFRKDKNGKITHELEKKIEYVMGSGNSVRSYIYSENGFFFEMPVSWYTEKKKWDLSPGYEKINLRFSRPIVEECMNCHNDYSGHIKFSDNKYHTPIAEGISCERCHGPGELHVKRYTEKSHTFEDIEKDSVDRTIVNPVNLPVDEQLSVCFQCHLQGEVRVFAEGKKQSDFKPGMKLTDVKEVFVQDNIAKGDFKIASHADRMFMCDCFINSKGAMTCITCHDPHKPVKDVPRQYFNDKCISCHAVNTLSTFSIKADHKPESDCIKCHMKQGGTKDVLHVNFTDHWIRKEIEDVPESVMKEKTDPKVAVKLKNFYNDTSEDSGLNLGIAYVKYFDTRHSHGEYLKTAMPLLEEGLKKFPQHKEGLFYLAFAYFKTDRIQEAVNILQKLTTADPDNAQAYFLLGTAFEKQKNTAKAIESYQKSLQIFPENIKALNSLGNLFYNAGRVNEAVDSYKKALNIISDNANVLNNLGDIFLYKINNLREGKAFIEEAIALDPDFSMALINLGNALMLEGNTAEAETVFRQVLEKEPRNVIAYGNLAVIYEDKGERNKAKEMLNKVLEIDPKDARALQMLENFK